MMKPFPTRKPVPASEQGYIILVAVFLLALLVISLAIAAPQVAKSIQRDRDLETFHRGMEYRRAVMLYYGKFHAYPPNVNALVETNDIRFLRKKYVDPITGKVDWKPILYGQNKVPVAMGFFGQPLQGGATSIAGIGPSGGNGVGGSGGSLPGGISSIFGSSSPTSNPSPGPTGTTSTSGGTSGTTGSPASTAPGSSSTGGSGSSTGTDQNGQTFGGGGIIGFTPASPKKSILIYKKKDHYNEWEFTYDPISDAPTISGGNTGGNGLPGGNALGSGSSGTGTTGSGTSGSGTSGSGTSGSGTNSNTPQQ